MTTSYKLFNSHEHVLWKMQHLIKLLVKLGNLFVGHRWTKNRLCAQYGHVGMVCFENIFDDYYSAHIYNFHTSNLCFEESSSLIFYQCSPYYELLTIIELGFFVY